MTGHDIFRLPKLLLLHAVGLLLAAATAAVALARAEGPAPRPWPRDLLLLVAAAVGWSSVMTVTSSHFELSMLALMTVLAAAMLFTATYNAAVPAPVVLLLVAFIPAVANGVFVLLQRTGVYNPFDYYHLGAHRLAAIGFLGNANDAGTYLVYPCLAAAALAVASPRHRWIGAAVSLVTAAGIAATETLGSIAALAAGALALAWLVSRKAFAVLVILGILGAAALAVVAPGRVNELREDLSAARAGDLDPLLSGRVPSLLAAWHLFTQRPFAGHGLDTFAAHYFDTKIALDEKHPTLMSGHSSMYAEAHNEYVQLLAEGGVPALLLFLAAMILLAMRSRGAGNAAGIRQRFARLNALPLATAVAVTSMAQFPMRLAAPIATVMYLGAITCAWSDDASA